MINVIQTLKNLNKEFPRFQLETLLKIVECIQEDVQIKTYPDWWTTSTYKSYPVTCAQNCATPENSFVYNTTTKNHTPDKTSYKQTIISEGEDATTEGLDFSDILNDVKRVIKATCEANYPTEE